MPPKMPSVMRHVCRACVCSSPFPSPCAHHCVSVCVPSPPVQVRAMQIIDELEVNKRGPYGGGVGVVSFTGAMDMALGLRTMIIPNAATDTLYQYRQGQAPRREWCIHLQAGAGVVADSVPEAEYEETVNKAAALGRAIDLAEQAFL